MEKIEFNTNVPVGLRLKFPNGREVPSRFKEGSDVMFTTTDDRSFYVSLAASAVIHEQIKDLGIRPGDPIEIVKAEAAGVNGRKATKWIVRRQDIAAGEQRNGTLAVPVMARASAGTLAPESAASQPHSNNGNVSRNGNGGAQQPAHLHVAWANHLLNTTNGLSDIYVAAMAYASQRYGDRIKPADVMALLTTAFLQGTRQGGPDVA